MSGETHIDFTANSGAHETAVAGNPHSIRLCSGSVSGQSEVREKKAGAVVATIDDKLSKDGRSLRSLPLL